MPRDHARRSNTGCMKFRAYESLAFQASHTHAIEARGELLATLSHSILVVTPEPDSSRRDL